MYPRPFFERADALDALQSIAGAQDLTIVVGAGASAEAGLPTWLELLTSLLKEVARRGLESQGDAEAPSEDPSHRKEDRVDNFAQWCLQADGQLGAAAIVRASFSEDEFNELLADHLYQKTGRSPPPGPTAKGIVRLKQLWGDHCEIITTNYDLLLESAFIGFGEVPAGDVITAVDDSPHPGKVVIRHLHGVCTRDGIRGPIVFAEGDYHRMQDQSVWQEDFVTARLLHSTCMFVGVGMSDPNLLRYLYRAKMHEDSPMEAVAIIVRQADQWEFSGDTDVTVRAVRAEAGRRRWVAAGVTPIQADYFVQSSQFVHKVALRRELRGAYVPYEKRLDDWAEAIDQGLLNERDLGLFHTVQDQLSSVLREWLDDSVEILGGRSHDGESLALQLWVRDPSTHSLILWASSDRSWRDPTTLARHLITRPTDRLAVEAFCTGNPVDVSLHGIDSRWNFLRAIPVFVQGHPRWGRLPVGVLTFSTTETADESVLFPVDPDDWDIVQEYLGSLAEELLVP